MLKYTAEELSRRALYRRAVEATIWGMPLVSVVAMREAFFRDAGAQDGDIVFWSKPSDWHLQFTTPNASAYYVYFNFNLKNGPMVLDAPAAVGAGLFGSLCDAWEVPVADVGPAGDDAGKGGRYLLLPPGYTQSFPEGYFPIRMETFNGYGLLRAIPVTQLPPDIARALDLVKHLRLYPLAQAAKPTPRRQIDMAGKLIDGVVKFDASYFDHLACMIEEEPILARDLAFMGQLRTVGIEKGKAFKPDAETRALLAEAAEEAHTTFMAAVYGGDAWWPGTHWTLPENKGPATGFRFEEETGLWPDQRGLIFFMAFAVPKNLGAATFYLVGAHDSKGEVLQGEKTYCLHIPPNAPAKQYWAATVYDLETCCLIRGQAKPGLDSYNQAMKRNPDGSVDIYFGPAEAEKQKANWIPTVAKRPWFALFRFYGPDKALFDKTWKLSDFEVVSG